MAKGTTAVDREKSARRIERDIETLAGPDYTRLDEAIQRYAYTPEYRNTLDYFIEVLEALGFEHYEDPVGTLVARNRPRGEEVFGVGSHCDSNRDGGKYDGTMGVVTALEVCRLNEELELELPPQFVSFLEEEGSGFGQMLLGGRIVAQKVSEEELREGFPSWGAARSDPGGAPRGLAWTAAQEARAPARRPGLQLPPPAASCCVLAAYRTRSPSDGTRNSGARAGRDGRRLFMRRPTPGATWQKGRSPG